MRCVLYLPMNELPLNIIIRQWSSTSDRLAGDLGAFEFESEQSRSRSMDHSTVQCPLDAEAKMNEICYSALYSTDRLVMQNTNDSTIKLKRVLTCQVIKKTL